MRMFPKIDETLSKTSTAQFVHCIICKHQIHASEATAGAVHNDGRQAFACFKHVWSRSAWVMAWARFEIEERRLKGTTGGLKTYRAGT